MKKIIKLFLVALVAMTLFACGGEKTPEEKIVGNWEFNFEESILSEHTNDYYESFVFYADGTVEYKEVNIRDEWYPEALPKNPQFVEINGVECLYTTYNKSKSGTYSLIHDGQKVEIYEDYGTLTLSVDDNKLIYEIYGGSIVFTKK